VPRWAMAELVTHLWPDDSRDLWVSMSFAPPRLEKFGPVVLAGVRKSHPVLRDRMEVYRDIAGQWREFAAASGPIPRLPPRMGYGVGLRMEEGATALDYVCGLAVASVDRVPPEFMPLAIEPHTVAVFDHHEHLSLLRYTIELIFATVLPMAGIEPDYENPVEFIQRYTDSFDPAVGRGGVEVLVPVKV
jgi:predicted transcriptional regulator YdeE